MYFLIQRKLLPLVFFWPRPWLPCVRGAPGCPAVLPVAAATLILVKSSRSSMLFPKAHYTGLPPAVPRRRCIGGRREYGVDGQRGYGLGGRRDLDGRRNHALATGSIQALRCAAVVVRTPLPVSVPRIVTPSRNILAKLPTWLQSVSKEDPDTQWRKTTEV